LANVSVTVIVKDAPVPQLAVLLSGFAGRVILMAVMGSLFSFQKPLDAAVCGNRLPDGRQTNKMASKTVEKKHEFPPGRGLS
jgi:hypothetical protein